MTEQSKKTVTVRIAVAVDPSGDWSASGWKDAKDAMGCAVESIGVGEARYWVTAELPIPQAPEVEGKVEND